MMREIAESRWPGGTGRAVSHGRSANGWRLLLATWALVVLCSGPALGAVWHGCALAPDASQAWVVAVDTVAICQTTDFGGTWSAQTILTDYTFFDVFFLDAWNGWTCGVIGEVDHTTDAGANWHFQGYGGAKFFSRLCFVDPAHGWAAGGAALMGRWDDSIQTWDLVETHCNTETCDFYGISFADTLKGWMCAGRYPDNDSFYGGQGYIVSSTNGGKNWTLLKRDTTNDYFDIKFTDSLHGWVVGGDDRTDHAYLARTTDGGQDWVGQTIDSAGVLRAVHFVDAEQGWAVGRRGAILHTSDSGVSWHAQTSGAESTLFDVDFSDARHGMACGAEGAVFTSDGGNTWVRSPVVGIRDKGARPEASSPRPELSARPSVARWPAAVACEWSIDRPSARGELAVFDVHGARINTLYSGRLGKGRFRAVWNGKDDKDRPVSSGAYVLRLVTANGAAGQKLLYLRE